MLYYFIYVEQRVKIIATLWGKEQKQNAVKGFVFVPDIKLPIFKQIEDTLEHSYDCFTGE
jgi:hypothetical protein